MNGKYVPIAPGKRCGLRLAKAPRPAQHRELAACKAARQLLLPTSSPSDNEATSPIQPRLRPMRRRNSLPLLLCLAASSEAQHRRARSGDWLPTATKK